MRYERILAEVLTMPWAITPEYLGTIAEILSRRVAGQRLTDEELEARISAGQYRAAARGTGTRVGRVAVMPVLGVMLPRGEALERTSGAVSTQQLTAQFDRLVAEPDVAAIVLDWDSPGGSVGGVAEFADRIDAARARKPIVSVANPMLASAAYWCGAAASELVASPSSLIGSIGVYTAHQDVSVAMEKLGVKTTLISAGRKKTLGNQFEPLSDEGRAEMQKLVDTFYDAFVRAVARGRRVAQRDVREGFGHGGVVGAAEAVRLKMADRIGTLDDAIAIAARRAGVEAAPSATAFGVSARESDEAAAFKLRLAALGVRVKSQADEDREAAAMLRRAADLHVDDARRRFRLAGD